MEEDVKGFMLIPVTVSVAGELTMLAARGDTVYPLQDNGTLIAALPYNDERWALDVTMRKV